MDSPAIVTLKFGRFASGLLLLAAVLLSGVEQSAANQWGQICRSGADTRGPVKFETAKTVGDLYTLIEFRAGRNQTCDKIEKMAAAEKIKFGKLDHPCWRLMEYICAFDADDKRADK